MELHEHTIIFVCLSIYLPISLSIHLSNLCFIYLFFTSTKVSKQSAMLLLLGCFSLTLAWNNFKLYNMTTLPELLTIGFLKNAKKLSILVMIPCHI